MTEKELAGSSREETGVSGAGTTQTGDKSVRREYAEAIVIALVLALLIRTFVMQAFKIPSESMLNTLLIGDHILVNKISMKYSDPQRKDIIVFEHGGDGEKKDFIKRVIGLPGEKLKIVNGKVFINDNPIEEPYIRHFDRTENQNQSYIFHSFGGDTSNGDNFGPVDIPPDKYFVMGDNRHNSWDSRWWGFVDRETIRGRAFLIYWSWDTDYSIRWDRFGKIVK